MEKCDEKVLWLDYKNITKVVQTGSHIYIDDGLISVKVKEIGRCTNNHLFADVLFTFLPKCGNKLLFILCVQRQRFPDV